MAFLPTWHWLTVGLRFFLEASLPHHLFFPSVGLGYRRRIEVMEKEDSWEAPRWVFLYLATQWQVCSKDRAEDEPYSLRVKPACNSAGPFEHKDLKVHSPPEG